MRAIIGIIIVFGILYAAGQWMWKEPKKTKVLIATTGQSRWIKDTLPSNVHLLKNTFDEWIVQIDSMYIRAAISGVYIDPPDLTPYKRGARLYNSESDARSAARSFIERSKTLKQQADERYKEKLIQDSINNLRYSTFKPAE